jgi:hypothetical protein
MLTLLFILNYARGSSELPLIASAQISILIELSQWRFAAYKALTF